MKKIFLDTNVILDDVLERNGAREVQQLYTREDKGQMTPIEFLATLEHCDNDEQK